MPANAGHRRGSVVGDTCFRCGRRVYLLERHLATTGQLFHRHCYRDSERTATLQRVSTRRAAAKENLFPPEVVSEAARRRKLSTSRAKNTEPAVPQPTASSVKENVLPPSQQPEAARQNKLSTSHAKNIEPAAPNTYGELNRRSAHATKLSEIPETADPVKCSKVTKKNPSASTTATQSVTPTSNFSSAAPMPKSSDNGIGSASAPCAAQQSNSRGIISSGAPCRPARVTLEDRNAAVATPKITVSAVDTTVGGSSTTNGNTRVTEQCAADRDRSDSRSYDAVAGKSSRRSPETSVPTVVDRARPALATARQPLSSAAKTTSPVMVQGKTTNSSPSTTRSSAADVHGVDRSCDVIPVAAPTRLVVQHAAPGSHQEQIAQSAVANGKSLKPGDRSALSTTVSKPASSSQSCFANDRDPVSATFKGSADRDSMSRISPSLPSGRFSDDPASVTSTPVSPKSEVIFTGTKMSLEPKRSKPFKSPVSGVETTGSPQLRTSAEKQNGPSTKTGYFYRSRSTQNLLGQSNEEEAASKLSDKSTITRSRGGGLYTDVGRPSCGKIDRPMSTYDLVLSSSKDDEKKSHEPRQNAANWRDEPTMKGLLENLKNPRQQKLQESDVANARGKETEPRMMEERAPLSTVSPTGKQLMHQVAVKRDKTSPTTSYLLESPVALAKSRRDSPSTTVLEVSGDRTSKRQNEYVSLAVQRGRARGITAKLNDVEPADSAVGTKKYVTKLQAELQRRKTTRQSNSPCNDQKDRQRSSEIGVAPVGKGSPFSIAGNCNISGRFSKSCEDLSQMASTPQASAASAVSGGGHITEWQLEAERRMAARGGRYVDPEKLRRLPQRDGRTSPSRMTTVAPDISKSMFELNVVDNSSASTHRDTGVPGSRDISSPRRIEKRSELSTSVDNLVAACSESSPMTPREREEARKPRIATSPSWNAASRERPSDGRRSVIVAGIPTSSAVSAAENLYESIEDLQNSPVAGHSSAYQVGDFHTAMAAVRHPIPIGSSEGL